MGLPQVAAHVDAWPPQRVGAWLTSIGLGEHAQRFVEQHVDGASLRLSNMPFAKEVRLVAWVSAGSSTHSADPLRSPADPSTASARVRWSRRLSARTRCGARRS